MTSLWAGARTGLVSRPLLVGGVATLLGITAVSCGDDGRAGHAPDVRTAALAIWLGEEGGADMYSEGEEFFVGQTREAGDCAAAVITPRGEPGGPNGPGEWIVVMKRIDGVWTMLDIRDDFLGDLDAGEPNCGF